MPLRRLPVRDFGTYRRGSTLSLRSMPTRQRHSLFCQRANSLERYSVISGEDLISEYESSPGAQRCFCSRCGSPVFARVAKDPDHIRIRLGTLDREVDAEITAHVWVGSKARWDRLTWAIPSFENVALTVHPFELVVERRMLRPAYDQHSSFIAYRLPRNPH